MKIIKATTAELKDIVFLNTFVQKMHAEQYPDIFKYPQNHEEVIQFFKSVIENEYFHLLIAYLEDSAVGYVWAAFEKKPETPFKYERNYFYIHQIVVHEQYRHQNIGNQLLNEITHIANQNGIKEIALDSWSFNKNAHRVFEKNGFITYKINMWRKE